MRSLVGRWLLITCLALLPALALQTWTGLSEHQARQQAVQDEALRLVHLVSSEQQQVAEGARQLMTALVNLSALRANWKNDCAPFFPNLLHQFPRYAAVAATDLDGRVVCSSRLADIGNETGDRAYFRRAMAQDDMVAGDYVVGRDSGRPSVHFAQRYRNPDGQVEGVISIALDLGWLQKRLDALPLPQGAAAFITDTSGTALARRPDPGRHIGQRVAAGMREILEGSELKVREATGLDGVKRVYGFGPFDVEPKGFGIAVGLDSAATFSAIAAESRRALALLALSAVLALAVTVAAAGPIVRRPMARLLSAAARWREGDFSARIGLGNDRSEFGRLGAAFDAMAEATQERERAVLETQAALRGSQAELSSILGTAAEGIVVARADGRIVSANRAALRMFGYDRAEELVGRALGVLMPAAEAARHGASIAAHRAGAPPRVIGVPGRELMAVRRDGSEFPIDLSVSSFGGDGRRCLTGIIRDATARKQAEAALRDSEARLRLVQQVGGVAFTDRRLAENTALVSPEFVRLYGLPPGQTHISAAAYSALVHPEDRDRMITEAGDVYEKGGGFASEFRIRRPDGTVRWVAMRAEVFPGPDGRPERAISAQQDITEIVAAREGLAARKEELERRVAERTAALAEAETRFRAIFDSQFTFIGLLSPDGILLEANRTALEAAGLQREDTVGKPFWETGWWPAAERDQLRREVAEAAGGAVIRREVEITGAGGRGIWIDFSLKPVRDPATGEVVWVIPEGRDITEQRTLSGQLAQAQKVQALGQLASGIAHDFNNVLQAVSGAALLIERRPGDEEKTRRLARTAINAATRGASITQRLLSFARRGELRTEAIATAELLDGVREVLAHTLGTLITVRTEAADGVPPVLADRGQLETALVNLGTNARDAMPNGGTLTFRAEAVRIAAGEASSADLAPSDYVRIDVSDTGSGMDAATLAKVTEPFFTTKPPGQGTGLGLPMVKEFADRCGGKLAIASAPGAGTTVSLWLRQAGAEAVPGRDDENGDARAGVPPARILLVDDDDLVRETLAAQLEDTGFAVLAAASGAEALALLQAGEAVSALVSDLSMPGMSGVETIQKARRLRPGLPCFLLTGYVGERAALAAEDAFTLVRKPVAGRALATRIEASLEVIGG